MPDDSKRIDAYIAKAADFAQPILKKLREACRKADPALVEELKWGVPSFTKNGLVCAFAAFKQHVTFTFFRGSRLKDPKKLLDPCTTSTVNSRSIKFVAGDGVDAKTLGAYVREAAALNATGAKPLARRPGP